MRVCKDSSGDRFWVSRVHLQRAPQGGRRLPNGRQLGGEAIRKAPLLRCSRRQPVLAARINTIQEAVK